MKKILLLSFLLLMISAFKWPGHCGAQDPNEIDWDAGFEEYEE